MEYLIPIMLVLLLVSGVVIFMVLNATKQSKPSEAADSDASDPKTMAAADDSPLGDTTEHSGEQSQEGETVRGPEGEGEGDGSASSSGDSSGDDADSGEERPRDTRPESERLANRDQV